MRRETIETSYFARCHFCSEIIVAERDVPSDHDCGWRGKPELYSRPLNDNRYEFLMRVRRPARRAVRSRRAA